MSVEREHTDAEHELMSLVRRENAARAQLAKMIAKAEAYERRVHKLQTQRLRAEADCSTMRVDYGVDVEGVATMIVVDRRAGEKRWIS